MSNVYEFVISLKDQSTSVADRISGGVSQIADQSNRVIGSLSGLQTKVQQTFGKLLSSANSAVKGPRFLEKSIDELKEELEGLNKVRFGTVLKSEFNKATKEAERLEKKIRRLEQGISGNGFGSKMKGWRADFASSLPGADLIQNPLTMAGAALGGIWSATEKAMEAGKEKMKMQVLTGSQEIGETLYNGLTKFATDTVFGNELYDMGAQMLANGIQSPDVLPLMKQLGDISMGDAEKLGSLSLAFSQVNSSGKLMGQDLNQMINAGFNPLQVISEKTGESMTSLKDRMAKGQITIDDVRKAMDMATGPGGKFHGMLEKVANTPYGQLEGLRGELDQMMVKIGEVFLPIASKMMQFFSWLSEKLGPLLQPLALILGGLSAGLLLVAAAQWAVNLAFLANPVTWVIAGIVALIGVIVWLISKISGWGEAWKIVVNNAKLIWAAFTSHAKYLWLSVIDNFMIGINKIKTAWYELKNILGIGDANENNQALARIAKNTEERTNEIAAAEKDFVDKTNQLQNGRQNALEKLKWNDTSLSDTVSGLKDGLGLGGLDATNSNYLGDSANQTNDKVGKSRNKQKEAVDGIVSGGSRQTNIVVNIGTVGKDITIKVDSTEKGISKLGEKVREEMLRAVNSVNQMQTT